MLFARFWCIVRVSLKVSLGAHVEPALQFFNVETRFPMLAEGSRSKVSLPFCLGITMHEGLFLADFMVFSLKQVVFQRIMVCHIAFVLL
jgi:hypothetical protein